MPMPHGEDSALTPLLRATLLSLAGKGPGARAISPVPTRNIAHARLRDEGHTGITLSPYHPAPSSVAPWLRRNRICARKPQARTKRAVTALTSFCQSETSASEAPL